MLYYLLYPLHTSFGVLNVTRYITFRTAAASLTALALSLLLGPWMIRKLRDFQVGQECSRPGMGVARSGHGTPGGNLALAAPILPRDGRRKGPA